VFKYYLGKVRLQRVNIFDVKLYFWKTGPTKQYIIKFEMLNVRPRPLF
jgi:hypothetical protein